MPPFPCVASGWPFVFGFTVYESFLSDAVAKTGHVPMPSPAETVEGGHAVVAVGYDDKIQRFIVRNSWGTGWGMKGYCTMPYGYLTDPGLASDFWAIYTVEKPAAAPKRSTATSRKRTTSSRRSSSTRKRTAGRR